MFSAKPAILNGRKSSKNVWESLENLRRFLKFGYKMHFFGRNDLQNIFMRDRVNMKR